MVKKRNIYLMYFIVFLQGLVFYGAISTVYRQAKGLSLYDIFIIESISWILMLLLEVPWGWFADRFGYKRTMVISNLVFFLSKIVFFAAASFPVFLIERVLLSLAVSGLSGCDITLLYLSKEDETSSEKLFARYRWCSTSGLLVAALLTPFILKISMEATTYLTMIPYGIAAAATFFLADVRGKHEEKPSIKESFRSIFKNKRFLLFVVSAALFTEVVQSVTVFLNQAQYVRSGIDIKYFGPLLALMQAIRLITVKSHRLSTRFGKIKSIGGLFAIILVGCAGLIFTASPAFSIILIALIGGSMALAEPMILDEQNSSVTTSDRASILSVYSMCGSAIAAAVNPFIGLTADKSAPIGFAFCAVICVAGVVLLFLYMKRPKNIER